MTEQEFELLCKCISMIECVPPTAKDIIDELGAADKHSGEVTIEVRILIGLYHAYMTLLEEAVVQDLIDPDELETRINELLALKGDMENFE